MDLQGFIKGRAKIDTSGCWLWQGYKRPDGYGVASRKTFPRLFGEFLAHRLSYVAFTGPVPQGYQLDHLCRQPACINPAHLEAVVSRTNTMRGNGVAALKAAQTHCIHGHPFDLVNTRFNRSPQGRVYRACKACERLRAAKRRQEQRKYVGRSVLH